MSRSSGENSRRMPRPSAGPPLVQRSHTCGRRPHPRRYLLRSRLLVAQCGRCAVCGGEHVCPGAVVPVLLPPVCVSHLAHAGIRGRRHRGGRCGACRVAGSVSGVCRTRRDDGCVRCTQKAAEPIVREGFNDGSEVGAGEKLLLLLQRWDVQNVVLIISIWEDGLPNTLTGERFKVTPPSMRMPGAGVHPLAARACASDHHRTRQGCARAVLRRGRGCWRGGTTTRRR